MQTSTQYYPRETRNKTKRCFNGRLLAAMALVLAGCGTVVGTTIVAANNAEQSRDRGRLNTLVEEHLKWVKELQAKGDPMGDYLWAEANEKANETHWITPPIQDQKIITQMYVDAAAKGSVDAQIMLGIKRFQEGSPHHFNHGRTAEEMIAKEPIWRDGLKMIDHSTKKQCWYYKPYIFAPHNKRCLAPRVAADDVWPKFRDGYAYPKDSSLRDYWYDKAVACEATPEFQQALRTCTEFGRTTYRAKE